MVIRMVQPVKLRHDGDDHEYIAEKYVAVPDLPFAFRFTIYLGRVEIVTATDKVQWDEQQAQRDKAGPDGACGLLINLPLMSANRTPSLSRDLGEHERALVDAIIRSPDKSWTVVERPPEPHR